MLKRLGLFSIAAILAVNCNGHVADAAFWFAVFGGIVCACYDVLED